MSGGQGPFRYCSFVGSSLSHFVRETDSTRGLFWPPKRDTPITPKVFFRGSFFLQQPIPPYEDGSSFGASPFLPKEPLAPGPPRRLSPGPVFPPKVCPSAFSPRPKARRRPFPLVRQNGRSSGFVFPPLASPPMPFFFFHCLGTSR